MEQGAAAHRGFFPAAFYFLALVGQSLPTRERMLTARSVCLYFYLRRAADRARHGRQDAMPAGQGSPGLRSAPSGTAQHGAGAGWEAAVPNARCAGLGECASLPAQRGAGGKGEPPRINDEF